MVIYEDHQSVGPLRGGDCAAARPVLLPPARLFIPACAAHPHITYVYTAEAPPTSHLLLSPQRSDVAKEQRADSSASLE